MTVFGVHRNNAGARVKALLHGKPMPTPVVPQQTSNGDDDAVALASGECRTPRACYCFRPTISNAFGSPASGADSQCSRRSPISRMAASSQPHWISAVT